MLVPSSKTLGHSPPISLISNYSIKKLNKNKIFKKFKNSSQLSIKKEYFFFSLLINDFHLNILRNNDFVYLFWLIVFFFLDRVSQLMISISDDYTFYLQTKILISIWCRRELNLRFLMINSLLILYGYLFGVLLLLLLLFILQSL